MTHKITVPNEQVKPVVEVILKGFKADAPVLEGLGKLLLEQVDRKFISGGDSQFRWPPNMAGKKALQNEELRRSFHYRVEGQTVFIWTKYPHAATHQFGAVIRPVRAKALFIPLKKTKRVGGALLYVRPIKEKEDRYVVVRLADGRQRKVIKFKPGEDFVFAKSARIPMRPLINFAPENIEEMRAFLVDSVVRRSGHGK